MYTIYALIDPRDDLPFYIGITDDVYKRFSQHLQCNETNLDKNERIQELKIRNLMLIMRTLEAVSTQEHARKREQHWIHHYLSRGVRLLNIDISQSFTYEKFQTFFEPKEPKQKKERFPVVLGRGEARQKAQRVLKKYPDIRPTELSKRADISLSSAKRVVAQQKALRILKRTPDIGPTELSKRANISLSSAKRILATAK